MWITLVRMKHPHSAAGIVKSVASALRAAAMALGLVVTLTATAEAAGLRTPFIEVDMGCLKPGHTFSVVEIRKLPLSVTNVGDRPVELAIEVVRPSANQLRKGYEAIPDTGWIRLQQNRFRVSPGKNAITDVFISVPDDKRYLGHRYQACLWSHTVTGGGVAAGLRSRLLFSICEE